MKLTSPAFNHNTVIPPRHTCDGQNTPPLLELHDVPAEAQSLVLIMDDPDIPLEIKKMRGIEVFDHWVLFNIPPDSRTIDQQTITHSIQGRNSRAESKYTAPCPPPQYHPREHRYFFKLYALDISLNLGENATKTNVEDAMEGHILAQAQLVGRYSRE